MKGVGKPSLGGACFWIAHGHAMARHRLVYLKLRLPFRTTTLRAGGKCGRGGTA